MELPMMLPEGPKLPDDEALWKSWNNMLVFSFLFNHPGTVGMTGLIGLPLWFGNYGADHFLSGESVLLLLVSFLPYTKITIHYAIYTFLQIWKQIQRKHKQ